MSQMGQCPACGRRGDEVVDSRPTSVGIRRRRRCVWAGCGHRWATVEVPLEQARVQDLSRTVEILERDVELILERVRSLREAIEIPLRAEYVSPEPSKMAREVSDALSEAGDSWRMTESPSMTDRAVTVAAPRAVLTSEKCEEIADIVLRNVPSVLMPMRVIFEEWGGMRDSIREIRIPPQAESAAARI